MMPFATPRPPSPHPLPGGRCPASFQLRFQSLFHQGRALTFPCDQQGQVELDTLSERARHNYLYARAVIGREYATPTVESGFDA